MSRVITLRAMEDVVQSHTWRCVPSLYAERPPVELVVPCLKMLVEMVDGIVSAHGS